MWNLWNRKTVIIVGVALVTLALDLITKWIALTYLLQPGEDFRLRSVAVFNVIPEFGFFELNLQYAFNTGGAFSVFEGNVAMLAIASILALGALIWWIASTPIVSIWLWSAFGLIIGGAIGNLIDRVRYKGVVDFIDAVFFGWHWPTFNIADSGICVGMGIIVVMTLTGRLDPPEAKSEPADAKETDANDIAVDGVGASLERHEALRFSAPAR